MLLMLRTSATPMREGLMRRAWLPALPLLLTFASSASAMPIVVPDGLGPGEQYRLVFVTSGTTRATSFRIADYNGFVDDIANAVPELALLSTTWTAIGSTPGADARDNTGTNPTVSVGVPIYNTFGQRIAVDNFDLWDGSLETPILYDETGSEAVGFAWTGSSIEGTSAFPLSGVVGNVVYHGRSFESGSTWVTALATNQNAKFRLYGISDVLVVPEPTTGVLVGLGLLGLVVRGQRGTAVRERCGGAH